MEVDNKAVEALTSFGLTEYEAKVYLTLVTKGTQKASTLADMSNIPRPHVYSVIKLLHEKGLITIIPEKVNKYQALPIDTVLDKLLEDRQSSIKSLAAIGNELKERLQDRKKTPESESVEKVRLYNGHWAIIHLIREMLGKANVTCDFITNDTGFVHSIKVYEQELSALKKRGVQIRFLMPVEKDTVPIIQQLSGIGPVKHLDSLDSLDTVEILDKIDSLENAFLTVLVIDSSEILFIRSQPGEKEESGIWTSQKELARMIKLMFKHMWQSAPELQARTVELETGRKPELLTPVYGESEVNKIYRGIISRSMNRVCCIFSQDQLIYSLNMFLSESKLMKKRGINFQILMTLKKDGDISRSQAISHGLKDISEAVSALIKAGAEVRCPNDDVILRMVLGDDEAIFNLMGDSISSQGFNMGVYTNHNNTIGYIIEYFNKLWENSTDITKKFEEISYHISKEVLKDGEDGLRKYFERLNELRLGKFAIKNLESSSKRLTVICTDPPDVRKALKKEGGITGDVCNSGREALRSFAQYIYEGTRMDCVEVKCVDKGDDHCEFLIFPADSNKNVMGNELLKFFQSIKTEKTAER
jgi:sugar-specific transcriptional regulator TrmB